MGVALRIITYRPPFDKGGIRWCKHGALNNNLHVIYIWNDTQVVPYGVSGNVCEHEHTNFLCANKKIEAFSR
jgi:hypothetical protein